MRKFRKTMALLLALALVLTTFGAVTVSAASFSDTQGHWAESVIDKWSSAGVVNGYGNGTFNPDGNITRAELAKVISTARQYTTEAEISFTDVADGDWYVSDLKKCVAQGVIGGYEDGTFKPDNEVTREEAAAMFQRAYQINSHGLITFADSAQISAWAETAISAMVGTGIINGYEDNTFRPAASITRAEVVKILDGISTIGAAPGATTAPGQNSVSSGTVVSGGLGGSGNGGFGGGIGGSGNTNDLSYNVTFNANGGTFADTGKDTAAAKIAKGRVIGGAAPVPAREGYLLDGWYTSKAAADELIEGKKWDINADPVNAGLILYAGWYQEGKVVVSFETNGGSPSIPEQTINTGEAAARPGVTPVREHYTFLGWYVSNTAIGEYDFSTPIRKNTRIYAQWKVDADYADKEVEFPTDTTGSFLNGTVTAAPPAAIPGENVEITVTAPEGYVVREVKAVNYISSIDGTQKTIDASYSKNTASFAMPEDVLAGSISVEAAFTLPERPTPTPAPPTATPIPTATPEPTPYIVSYVFSEGIFEGVDSVAANADMDGLSVDAATEIGDSKKTFTQGQNLGEEGYIDGSGNSYTRRLRVNKANTTVHLYGPCKITIDASGSNNDDDKGFNLEIDGKQVGYFEIPPQESGTSCFYDYKGGVADMVIKPFRASTGKADNIQIYGIYCDYGMTPPVIPTATPVPTKDPNAPYPIALTKDLEGGSLSVTANGFNSDNVQSVTWQSTSIIGDPPKDVAGDDGNILPGKTLINLNGRDDSDGTLMLFEDMHWEDVQRDGGTYRIVRGKTNPVGAPPWADDAEAGAVFRIHTPKSGRVTLKGIAYTGKTYSIFDENLASPSLSDFIFKEVPGTNYVELGFNCEANHNYYFYGGGGTKVGIQEITIATALESKRGDTVEIEARPDAGNMCAEIQTDPVVKVKSLGNNKYSLKMPAEELKIAAKFAPEGSSEHLAQVGTVTNGSVTLSKPDAVIGDEIVSSEESFMKYAGNGGEWIVSSDGFLPTEEKGPTAIEEIASMGNNDTTLMEVTDKAVQYVLDKPIENGPFTLSYDFYQYGVASAGRSFRLYLDNAAHPYDENTGKASAMGTDGAFFHMTNVDNKVYVTQETGDLGAGTAKGVQVGTGDQTLGSGRWYRVVITGEAGTTKPLTVSYYYHGTSGASYEPDNINPTPELTTNAAPVTTGRDAVLKQIKFMRTASGTLYIDNVKLVDGTDTATRAYPGEKIQVNMTPNSGYEGGNVVVTDSTGANIEVDENGIFTMPNDNVTINVEFGSQQPDPAPEGLKALTEDYTFVADKFVTAALSTGDQLLDDGRVYASGGNKYSNTKKTSSIGGEDHLNCLGVKMPTVVAVMPAFDATITVYTNSDDKRTIGAGIKKTTTDLYKGENGVTIHTFDVKAGTCVFITGIEGAAGGDVYIGGIEVKHKGAAAEAAAAEETDETVDAVPAEETAKDEEIIEEAAEEAADETADEAEQAEELPTPDEAAAEE